MISSGVVLPSLSVMKAGAGSGMMSTLLDTALFISLINLSYSAKLSRPVHPGPIMMFSKRPFCTNIPAAAESSGSLPKTPTRFPVRSYELIPMYMEIAGAWSEAASSMMADCLGLFLSSR